MTHSRSGVLLTLSLLSLSAWAADSAKAQWTPEIPSDPKAYLERLHQANLDEIQMAELAKTRASNSAVRDYANMLSNDHKAADQKLLQAAQSNNLKLGPMKPMNDREKRASAASKAMAQMLESADGPAFDQSYIAFMVADHDHDLGKLMAGQEKFGSAPWASVIRDMIPTVSQHRDQAYQILGTLKPSVQATGTGGSGVQDAGHMR